MDNKNKVQKWREEKYKQGYRNVSWVVPEILVESLKAYRVYLLSEYLRKNKNIES
jgi:hypothetical protein